MRKILLAVIYLFIWGLVSKGQNQELFITYNYISPNKLEQKAFEVTSNKHACISILKSGVKEGQVVKAKMKNGMEIDLPVPPKDNPDVFVYKNYNEQYLISQDKVADKYFFTKEPLIQMQWQLTGNTKKLLKYNCQEATTTFRGRDYVVYFTAELPFKAAPFKFYGLPGVVLQIKTIDEQINIQASRLKVQPSGKSIQNPFENKPTITWEEFTTIYAKKVKAQNNKVRSLRASEMSAGKQMGMDADKAALSSEMLAEDRLEVIVKGNDWGYIRKPKEQSK